MKKPAATSKAIAPVKGRPIATLAEFENLGPIKPADRFALVNQYHDLARLSMAQSCAYMILAGVELIALKKDAEHGTWQKLFPEPGAKSANACAFAMPLRTAQHYMAFAAAAKKNVPALQEVCASGTPLSLMDADQREQLVAAAKKTGDGKTYGDLATEWGIAKKPRGSAAKGGDTSGDDDSSEDSPEQAAVDLWTPIIKGLALEGLNEKSWAHLPDKGEISRETLEGLITDLAKQLRDAKPVKKGERK